MTNPSFSDTFVYETGNQQKIKFFLIGLFIIFLISVCIYGYNVFQHNLPNSVVSLQTHIMHEITQFTTMGVFYLGLVGGLFFIPLPLELFFFKGLLNGNSFLLSMTLVSVGFLMSQIINYILGSKAKAYIIHFISKKKLYSARRWVSKHGSLAILIFNILPLPAPLLTFALGIIKYNPVKLFTLIILGLLIKFMSIGLLHHFLF